MSSHYTHIPPTPTQLIARTFAILPPPSHVSSPYWLAQDNTLAKDEVSAHMGMFNAKSNDGFYALGLKIVADVGARVEEEGVIRRAPPQYVPGEDGFDTNGGSREKA
jgi:hypothetical protein